MGECYPCESFWCNCGNMNGVGLLAGCCGFWCCKGFIMEQFDPNFCYCFQQSGLGCNCFCCGCTCCHPIWMNLYIRQQFPTIIVYQNDPYGNGLYPQPSPYPYPPY